MKQLPESSSFKGKEVWCAKGKTECRVLLWDRKYRSDVHIAPLSAEKVSITILSEQGISKFGDWDWTIESAQGTR